MDGSVMPENGGKKTAGGMFTYPVVTPVTGFLVSDTSVEVSNDASSIDATVALGLFSEIASHLCWDVRCG
jgi:hypothetical protein